MSQESSNAHYSNKLTKENLEQALKNQLNGQVSFISNSQIFSDPSEYCYQQDKGKFTKRIAVSPTPSQKNIKKKLEGN